MNQQAYNFYYQQLYKLYWQMLCLQYLQTLTQAQQTSTKPNPSSVIRPLSSEPRDYLSDYTTRGFTGHDKFAGAKFECRQAARRVNNMDVMNKMVDVFGIINMGGRIYDAALGRVLQADPCVQDPTNTQSFNRYTYVFNNPLSYTDPSGYFSLRNVVGIVAGAVVGFFLAVSGFGMFAIGFYSAFTTAIIITGNLKTALKAGLIAGALAFAGNGFSNSTPFTDAANTAGNATGATGDLATSTTQSSASSVATDAATKAALRNLIKDIVTQIAQSIDPKLGSAVDFLANSGNYTNLETGKLLSPGKLLRNLTSKYSQLKSSEELERFANRNGMTLGELNLFLITASFLGNKIVGTRFEQAGYLNGDEDTQGVHGMFDRQNGRLIDAFDSDTFEASTLNRVIGGFFDVIDVVLGYQGLLTASSYDFIKNGNSNQLLYGHSLGTLDANNLLSRGFVNRAHLDSLPFGNIGVSGSTLDLGTIDPVNGFVFGFILNPFAKSIKGCWHPMACYHPGN